MKQSHLNSLRIFRRKKRIRGKISGTALVPRLSVYKSNNSLYCQLINDQKQVTIAGAHSLTLGKKNINKQVAQELGKIIADKASQKGIKRVVFDRGGNKYTGNIATLADSARQAGLMF